MDKAKTMIAGPMYLVDSPQTMELHFMQKQSVEATAKNIDYYKTQMNVEGSEYTIIDSTALIKVQGVLEYSESFWSWIMGNSSYEGLARQLRHSDLNEDVEDAVLLIDSPGGDVAGISCAVEALKDFSKPLTSRVVGTCASGAYYLACVTDEIEAYALSIVGSVGVFSMQMRYESEWAKEYFVVARSSNAEHKNTENPTVIQERLDDIERVMFTDIAQGRGWSFEEVGKKTGNGRVFSGSTAYEKNLIDKIIESEYTDSKIEERGGASMPKPTVQNTGESQIITEDMVAQATHNAGVSEMKKERERCSGLAKICSGEQLAGFIADGTTVGDAAIKILADRNAEAKPEAKSDTVTLSADDFARITAKVGDAVIEGQTTGALGSAEVASQSEQDTLAKAKADAKGVGS